MRAGTATLLAVCAVAINAEQQNRLNPIRIDHLFNSKGTSLKGENDGIGFRNGSTWPQEYLPTGLWTHDGVPFLLPDWSKPTDNIAVEGQTLLLDPLEVSTIHLLGAGQDPRFLKSETTESLNLSWGDGSVSGSFLVRNWWCIHGLNKGAIRAPYNFNSDGSKNWNATHLFHITVDVPPKAAGHCLTSITLPSYAGWNNLHIFALTLDTVGPGHPEVRSVRATRRWKDVSGTRGQVVEVTLKSPLPAWSRDAILDPLTVSIEGVKTLLPATLTRFMPGDEQTLEIVTSGSAENVTVHFGPWSSEVPITGLGVDPRSWTDKDLETHSAPSWYNGAKFGIFIHWGLFAVPAFGPPKQYAEWYDWWLHDDPVGGPTYQHHLETYGQDFVYDNFINDFTASQFNASEWVDFLSNAGAKYFVFSTKHHDGYALFDTKSTSNRNSIRLGPKRDFLRELMDAAESHPELHRGTYFSMPEWFNPLYQKYGKHTFPGGLARNPYDGEPEPYTGFVEVDDYLDMQLEQMRILAHDYKTEIMWCDIGLANRSSTFASEWYAAAALEGRQVTMNDRCGIGGDFDTPEMFQFAHAERARWESCAGMDPYSFGYNAATPPEAYRSAKDIIHTLVDITAKGGNFLLNVGPNKEGKIIEDMTKPLLETGSWLKLHGAAIYDTVPFWMQAEYKAPGIDVRFTRSALDNGVFYIISLLPPSQLAIQVPLPILEGDTITLLSTHGSGSRPADPRRVHFEWKGQELVIDVEVEEQSESIAWVFEIQPKVSSTAAHLADEL